MKVSTPAAYQDIFPVFTGTTLTNYVLPPHRGLFVATTVTNTSVNAIIIENLDGTTSSFPLIANTATVVPLTIKKMTTVLGNNTGTKIYGLL